ncbi:metalloregulator ArsR/SmtB family transcription factor [Paenibacillus sp. JCM 10914]|uniref:ArsR/SmtB family transcription factor n=1 Tax=Paenibacillus sp. JCM 10914 TaxID=1236974 RepID=UPI0003CC58F4|nr:metalloregulator ArsR/SmtB family transcription factor [Paenibacillus sp. JCM 10914]GAE07843.1 transcriptional regulator, ArsR family [Paenibacillus sp. JCM 10914]
MMNDKLFEVLAEPNRRIILDHLRHGERTVGEIVEIMPLSQPGVSKHLRILREAGLVLVRKDAQRHLYRLHAEPLADIHHWLEPYRQFWTNKLEDLERALDQDESK